eukprot:Plantae.Rhodophyta-Purpureofilum_apyrenoidigerum.ctg17695.p1 GENE.Plantae.Rhodophyta-Purpureofilum_apyrenoidigerum.ctg17695~~Plantae.Rhodophyta-Purpureofilum_apyrenoidigerum.ctg17695.p1  ORF type:complete len:211 (-),score=35.89 Plantae.Rhodophyta-Purpureofilum_apyrenoidigerum.ctg17695:418-1050(-)
MGTECISVGTLVTVPKAEAELTICKIQTMKEKRVPVEAILLDEENVYSCYMCELECSSMDDLKEHVFREHAGVAPTLTCDLCSLEFKQRNRLERHKRAVHEKRRPFKCTTCDILFAEKNNLLAHMDTVHERKRPFACSTCHSRFGRKNNLQRHVQTVHEKRRPFKCPCCNMSFGEKGNLLTHKRRKHAKRSDDFHSQLVDQGDLDFEEET